MYLQIVHLSHLSANVQSEVFVLAQFLMFYFVYKNNYFTFTVNLGRLCVIKVNVLDCLACGAGSHVSHARERRRAKRFGGRESGEQVSRKWACLRLCNLFIQLGLSEVITIGQKARKTRKLSTDLLYLMRSDRPLALRGHVTNASLKQ